MINKMLSEKLKEKTKTAHIELEKVLAQKIKSIRNIEDYLEILAYFYRFFNPLEKAIFSQLKGTLPDVAQRRKTEWILEDLDYFRPSRPAISPYLNTPDINNNIQAIGALYVIEGSTLGGEVICRMVSQRLGVYPEPGFKFFSGYGEDTAQMWEDFKNFINSKSWTPEEEDEIINTAGYTFGSFKQVLA